jgi:hypothetical protein
VIPVADRRFEAWQDFPFKSRAEIANVSVDTLKLEAQINQGYGDNGEKHGHGNLKPERHK